MAPSIFNIDGLFTMLSANGAIAGDSLTISSTSMTGTGTALETDIGQGYIFSQKGSINYSSGSNVPFIKCSGDEIYVNITDINGNNGGAGDSIGVQALAGGKVYVNTTCNACDISYSADGAGSEIHTSGELVNAVSETTGGLVYRHSPSEGVYYPNLPATAGLALTDLFKIYKAGVAEKATLLQLQTLINPVVPTTLATKSGVVPFGSFALSGGLYKATVTFGAAFAAVTYSPNVTGSDVRSWTIESLAVGSFIINSNSAVAPTGNTYWNAILNGET